MVNELGVDFLSIAGHKLYAPKGIGALYIKESHSIEPLIHGAGHENGRRAGTENVIFEAGLGHACSLAKNLLTDNTVQDITNRFYHSLKTLFGNKIQLNGHPDNRLPNTLFISFLGFPNGVILKALSGVAVSTGSACHSDSTSISPVLKAMGLSPEKAGEVIRFSLGRFTTQNEIDLVLDKLSDLENESADYSI
jgi:cysteine desulfurase